METILASHAPAPDGADWEVPEDREEKHIYDCRKLFRSAKSGNEKQKLIFASKMNDLLNDIVSRRN